MKERGNSRETLCGLGPWRPRFLQPLASKKMYMFFYGALGIVKVNLILTNPICILITGNKLIYVKYTECARYVITLLFSRSVGLSLNLTA
jgi:hypothetical protein